MSKLTDHWGVGAFKAPADSGYEAQTLLPLFAPRPAPVATTLDGATAAELTEDETVHMGKQLGAMFTLMADGKKRTLTAIQHDLMRAGHGYISTPSVSARLRDLRKPKFGSHAVIRERALRAATGTMYTYRLVQNPAWGPAPTTNKGD